MEVAQITKPDREKQLPRRYRHCREPSRLYHTGMFDDSNGRVIAGEIHLQYCP